MFRLVFDIFLLNHSTVVNNLCSVLSAVLWSCSMVYNIFYHIFQKRTMTCKRTAIMLRAGVVVFNSRGDVKPCFVLFLFLCNSRGAYNFSAVLS